jgi:spore maturation protein CgeB
MRIGVVGPVGPDLFADNVGNAFGRAGHFVTQLGPTGARHPGSLTTHMVQLARQAWPSLDERAQRRIVQSALEAECELVINLDLNLTPNTVTQLRRSRIRVAFWFPDAVVNMGRQLMLLGAYDALFFKEPHLVDRLRANLEMPVYYLPQGCSPQWHRPLVPAGTEPHLVVAGNMYPSRVHHHDLIGPRHRGQAAGYVHFLVTGENHHADRDTPGRRVVAPAVRPQSEPRHPMPPRSQPK